MYNRRGEVVTTSVNTLEIHDIARTCMTFGVEICYIVTPLPRQREIARRLVRHWREGYGRTANPDRSEALERVRIMGDLDETVRDFGGDAAPLLVGTSSRERGRPLIGFATMKALAESEDRGTLLIFGTGSGLADEVTARCDMMLAPIRGKAGYNHLPLRMAAGIILDRIFGERGGDDERDD